MSASLIFVVSLRCICPDRSRLMFNFLCQQVLNYNHLMPTRYTVDVPLEKLGPKDLKDPAKRKALRFQTRVKFEERLVQPWCSRCRWIITSVKSPA